MKKMIPADIEGDLKQYVGFKFRLENNSKVLLKSTNEPFKWFPELAQLFKNFPIKDMEFEVNNKVYFRIFRKEENK